MKKVFFFALLCSYGNAVISQNLPTEQQLDTVVIDSKTPLLNTESGKVVVKIGPETIKMSQGSSVAELLNEQAGIEINGARSYDGQNPGYFIRGGSNRQVVIMVDGVQLNDASQIANDYDLRLLDLSSIESIEVLKGASSVLYGSGAATAVISIRTKKASKKPFGVNLASTLGTNKASGDSNTAIAMITNRAAFDGSLGRFFYSAEISNRYTDGLSAIAPPDDDTQFEADTFNRYDGRVNLGVQLTEKIRFSQFFSFNKYKSGFDDFSYTDADHRTISEQFRSGGNFEWQYGKGTYVFNDSFTRIERAIESGFPALYDSQAYSFDTYLDHRISDKIRLLLGLNGNFSKMNASTIPFGEDDFVQQVDDETARFTIVDPYLNAVFLSGFGLNLNAGIRLNIHSEYDMHLVYNINPSYSVKLGENALKLLTSYSTAYITPSLFQLYDPVYGNKELKPEENRTIEAGVEFSNKKLGELSAVYFNRKEDRFIDFVVTDPDQFLYQYQNSAETFEASGLEVTASINSGKRWNFNANYTYTVPDERFALRIPEHKINGSFGYRLWKAGQIIVNYQYLSSRDDVFFNPDTFESETVNLASYDLVGLKFRSQLNDEIALFASVFNVFDTKYEELYRYQTRGRNYSLGFSLSL